MTDDFEFEAEEEFAFDNVSTQEFLDNVENIIIKNPDMDGVEIEDSQGRWWFIELTSPTPRMN